MSYTTAKARTIRDNLRELGEASMFWPVVVAVGIVTLLVLASGIGADRTRCEDAQLEIVAHNQCANAYPACVMTPDHALRAEKARRTLATHCGRRDP